MNFTAVGRKLPSLRTPENCWSKIIYFYSFEESQHDAVKIIYFLRTKFSCLIRKCDTRIIALIVSCIITIAHHVFSCVTTIHDTLNVLALLKGLSK
jgi:hypothetical protein